MFIHPGEFNSLAPSILEPGTKAANSGLEYVKIPHSELPTYAGQERAEGAQTKSEHGENVPKSKPLDAGKGDNVDSISASWRWSWA
jgi:hypothetical protein